MKVERTQRGVHLNIRVPRDLEEKLEMYRELRHHKSLSHTIKYFLKLGIKSTELLEQLEVNPSMKDDIVKEWKSSLKFMISDDIIADEFDKISDTDLETVVMAGYIELTKRKMKMRSQEYDRKKNQINEQAEVIFESRIGENAKSK